MDENKKDMKNVDKTNIKKKNSFIIKKINISIQTEIKMIQILHQVVKIQMKEIIVIVVQYYFNINIIYL